MSRFQMIYDFIVEQIDDRNAIIDDHQFSFNKNTRIAIDDDDDDDDLARCFNDMNSEIIEQVNHLDDEMSDLKLEETDSEMLRQVHDLNKRFNCQVCGKKFARKLYKTFHEQHCNGEDRGSICRLAKQFKIDNSLTKKPASIEQDVVQSGGGDDQQQQHKEEQETPKLIRDAIQSDSGDDQQQHKEEWRRLNLLNLLSTKWLLSIEKSLTVTSEVTCWIA